METRLKESAESNFLPSYSGDYKETVDGSSQNSPPPPPPTKTLDVPLNGSPTCDFFSAFCEEALDDQSDSALFLDAESQEAEEETNTTLCSSPVNTVSAFSSSHWSSVPWSSHDRAITSATGSADRSFQEETETKPLVSVSPASDSEIKPAMVGAGLANLGNTCFLNAVLQCFTHTVPLVQGLWSFNHPRPCDRDSEGCCVLCALRDHIDLSLASMGRVVSPWKLVDNLSYISSNFRRFQQEDAHEFLQCLLDRLDSCFTYSEMKDKALTSKNENLVKQVFGGRLISKLRCCNCGHCSDTYEPSIDLSLEIDNVGTLNNALESFTKVERIEDPETQFTCEKCKERVSIEKQLMLDQAPSVATFHLKRFKNDGSFVEKVDKHVEFPLELDLLPYTSGNQNNEVELKYDLYAVVVHTGVSSTSGHYYCFVRSAQAVWYRLDDSKVARVREDFVLSQEAYILFYTKQGTPLFSSFMEAEKLYFDQLMSNTSPKSVLDNMDHISTSSPNVTNNCSFEVKTAEEEVVGISVESFNGNRNGAVQGNEAKGDSHSSFTPVPLRMSNSSSGTSAKVGKKFSPSALKENDYNQEFNGSKNNIDITPSMPPRSPSPDIYAEEPPVASYSIPRDHLMSEKQVPCKRKLEQDLEDSHRKQARMLLKNMPNARSSKLLAAMNGSHNLNDKKSGRKGLPSDRNNRPSNTSHKPNLNSFMRPVAAGSLR